MRFVERCFPDDRVNDAGLIETELYLTGFDVANRGADVRRDRSGFRIRHFLGENAPELFTDLCHHVRRSHCNVEFAEAAFDAVDQILIADDVGAGFLRRLRVVTLSECDNANDATRSVRQQHRAANVLVALFRIDAETNVGFDCFGELRVGVFLDERNRFGRREQLPAIVLGEEFLEALPMMLWHYASTSTPIERAVPATMRFAASMSLALMSGIFTLAIDSSWACVSFPTLLRLGSLLPDSIWSACLMRNDAGGVLVTKLNVRSSKTVISTGMIMPACDAVRSLYCLQKSMMLSE